VVNDYQFLVLLAQMGVERPYTIAEEYAQKKALTQ